MARRRRRRIKKKRGHYYIVTRFQLDSPLIFCETSYSTFEIAVIVHPTPPHPQNDREVRRLFGELSTNGTHDIVNWKVKLYGIPCVISCGFPFFVHLLFFLSFFFFAPALYSSQILTFVRRCFTLKIDLVTESRRYYTAQLFYSIYRLLLQKRLEITSRGRNTRN